MPMLFCNTAWMNFYKGRDEDDPPRGGGEYVSENGQGHEECNFVPWRGHVYGYVHHQGNINLARLGAAADAPFVDGVDVIWTATRPSPRSRVIVGWYKNARVYKEAYRIPGGGSRSHRSSMIDTCRIEAAERDAHLVPPANRNQTVRSHKKGWPGHNPLWYADQTDEPEAKRFVEKVKGLIRGVAPTKEGEAPQIGGQKGRRVGGAASEPYRRYLEAYELIVGNKHHKLQEAFKTFLAQEFPDAKFPKCIADDLKYHVPGQTPVMVEIKPTEDGLCRFAIRAAIGQLIDYRHAQKWSGICLIVISSKPNNQDVDLALKNGFGIGWAVNEGRFQVRWPEAR